MAVATAIAAVTAVVAGGVATAGATGAIAMSTIAIYATAAVALGGTLKVTGDIVRSKELSLAGTALGLAGAAVNIANAYGAFDSFTGAEAAAGEGGFGSAVEGGTTLSGAPVGSPEALSPAAQAAGAGAGGVTAPPPAPPTTGVEQIAPQAPVSGDSGGGMIEPSSTVSNVASAGPSPVTAPLAPAAVGAPQAPLPHGPFGVNPITSNYHPDPSMLATGGGAGAPATTPANSDFIKAMMLMTGAQAVSGLAGGYFTGMSAEDRLQFDQLMNQQKYQQAQEILERGRYAPRLSFKGPVGPAGTTPRTGMIGGA